MYSCAEVSVVCSAVSEQTSFLGEQAPEPWMAFQTDSCTLEVWHFHAQVASSHVKLQVLGGPKGAMAQSDLTLFLTGLEIKLVKELVCLVNVIK